MNVARCLVFAFFLTSILGGCPTSAPQMWAAAPAQDYSAAGPFSVQQAEFVLHDTQRNKDVPVVIYYPEPRAEARAPHLESGPSAGTPMPQKFPIIVFSHGAGASGDTYQNWGHHWASHGYISIHPTHDDSLALRRARGEQVRLLDPLRTAMRDEQAWRNRPRDISFVLDSIENGEIERRVPMLKGRLDGDRIGVGGHSFGAYTAQAIGGAVSTAGNFRDPRVRAVVLMSPQGRNQMGMTVDSWKNFTIPAMIMTGPRDAGMGGHDPLWRKDPYLMSPPGDKYFVWVEDASHFTFGGQQRAFRRGNAGQLAAIKATTTAFWDAYLKQDAAARQALASGTFMPQSAKVVRVDHR
jgi:predicted dienelactone hydrolase